MSEGLFARLVAERRVVVCVGAGGVGKTTVAAAIALFAAVQGRRALVCTIDPARRLATSLGLGALGNSGTQVLLDELTSSGVEARGTLFAMMLDLKRAWDELIERHAPVDRKDAILASPIYQQLSTALAGSQEYVAMEKVANLAESGEWDLVVLDTPPTAHALDFLDAPDRVLDFFGGDAARWLLAPVLKAGSLGLKAFTATGGTFVKTLSRMTGVEMLREIAEFLLSLNPMVDVFKERAASVKALLASSEAAFVLVSSASALAVDEAAFFHRALVESRIPVRAAVANRICVVDEKALDRFDADPGPLEALLAGAGDEGAPPVLLRVRADLAEARVVARADARELGRLVSAVAETPVVRVPRFEADVTDLADLWKVAQALFGSEPVPAGPVARGRR